MSFKKINLIAIPVTVALAIFRFFHLLYATDATSGFSTSPIFDVVLYSVLGALLLFFVFNFYYSRRAVPSIGKGSRLISYSLIIFAAYCEFMSVLQLIVSKNTVTDNTNLRLIQTIETICAVLGIIVGICIVFESVKAMSLSTYTPSLLVCGVTVLYFIMMLFTYYATHETMVTVSQNLIGLFFWMSAIVFVYAYLRFLSASKTATSYKLALVFGYFTASLGAVVSLPRIVASFFVNLEFTDFSSIEQRMILPTTAIALLAVYRLTVSNKNKTEE